MGFRTALIVDDSKLARVTLKKKLEAHGLVVHVVDSAAQAYACLPSTQPDIIFMDHLMPEIDGFEATQHIRQMDNFGTTPIVMCTGKDHDGYLQEALAIGANFILSKPPVDEALAAILAAGDAPEETLAAAAEPDVADFMSGHDELAVHTPVAVPEPDPVLETDVADFMEEPLEVVVARPVIEQAPGFDGVPAVDMTEVERLCRQIVAAERAVIINHVMSSLPAPPPLALQAAGVDADEVARICEEIIATERNAIIHDVLASVPAPAIPDMSAREGGAVDMEAVLSTVNATLAHQLAVSASTQKAAIAEQVQHDLDTVMNEKISEALGRDIQGILEVRLNVMLAEKMAVTHDRLAHLEQVLEEKLQLMNSSADLFAADSPLKLAQPNNMSDRVSDLYEKYIDLQLKLKKFQWLSLGAVAVAAVAIVMAVVL